ncbi:MAG: S9 family peptidase [Cyanobacteria bacterium J003]|uniref:dipeptidyl-peptidase 5 n=1 Tax=Thermosynechococcus sp. M3746_W2019_013 TaxID=2747806 RepID=UPI000F0FB4B9|nr:S9 family peptidase [Thermosynechococcus sp. M3746_W2019_013]RMH66881.1 MAG: S9 family peptidase [Cyanobacteria bacterium J003]HIK24272.1 S9 family peptidase [Thermosynechococcus sp. M3746_W2019_013]
MSLDCGYWPSILSAAEVSAAATSLSELCSTPLGLVWLERRPQQKGRVVLVRQGQELLAAPWSARSRVNEYGGGAYWCHGDQIYFVNDTDQGIYALGEPHPTLIYQAANTRFADGCVDPWRDRLLCVQEVLLAEGRSQQSIVAIALGGERTVLVQGAGFYGAPRLSPDGKTLVWLQWSAPQMPWDGCELWGAMVSSDGSLGTPYRIAGSSEESVQQPQWQGKTLYYISDRSGWWNLYRYCDSRHDPVWQASYDAGVPLWVFGQSTYALVNPETAVLTYSDRGLWQLAVVSLETGKWQTVPTDYTEIHSLVRVSDRAVAFVASSPLLPPHIGQFNLEDGTTTSLRPIASPLPPEWISQPERIAFPTTEGATAYGFFYPPQNPQVQPPSRPPLIVRSHGGPTAASGTGLDLRIQFWTSRGFAVLDVNYRGSTGYGRAYRNALRGQWGVVDVADCVAGAEYLVAQGRVAGDRLAIRGSSAGGYTTLCALTFTRVFHVGASYYGIGDLLSLLKETHAFEAHYFDQLIAPYPEGADLYRQRSPLYHADCLTCPVIFFQGLKDVVVPPGQAEQMVAALQAKGIPVEYYTFAEEGHGFRQSSTIATALEAELRFYQRHLLKSHLLEST